MTAKARLLSALLTLPLAAPAACVDPGVAVLHADADAGDPRVRCPAGSCEHVALAEVECMSGGPRYEVVIVDGHSAPPVYLDTSASDLAARLACLAPSLIVLDTCYGFSAPLLAEIAEQMPGVLVVGSTDNLWMDGLDYGPGFFAATTPDERARHVASRLGESVQTWRPDPRQLAATRVTVDTWPSERLREHLVHTLPNLVRAASPGAPAVLFVVAPERFE